MEDEFFNTYSVLLERTSRQVKRYAKRRFKEFGFGITVDQWIILKNLDEKKTFYQSELAEIIFKDTATLTRIIDLLCKKGFLERINDESDRRKFQLRLTEAGSNKVKEISPQISLIRKKAWDNLSKNDFEHFKSVLNTIYENLA